MGMLSEIKKNSMVNRLEQQQTPTAAPGLPPKEFSSPENSHEEFHPCVCGNFYQWQDAYGFWHCHECEPPRVAGMVKAERDQATPNVALATPDVALASGADGVLLSNPTANGFRVLAVAGPLWPVDGEIAFAPEITQAERREIVEGFEWFERRAANRATRDAVSHAKKNQNEKL